MSAGFSASSTPQETTKQTTTIPDGYSTGDTYTPYSLASGRSRTFSVPRDHLAKELSIEIEFWYEWENIDNELGDYLNVLSPLKTVGCRGMDRGLALKVQENRSDL